MGMAFSRPIVLLVLLAALVLALLQGLRGNAGFPRAGRMVPDAQMTGSVPVPAPRGAAAPAVAPVAQQGAAWPPAVHSPDSRAIQRRAGLSEGFEQADDLYAYLQELLPAAQAGDADAAWFASRVYDYCAVHATDPAAYMRDTGALGRMQLAASATMRAARDRVAHRCRQFVPGDGLGAGLVILQRLEAAEAGSLAAEAGLLAMGEPLEEGEGYRRGLVERVQASADAEAFFALAPAMGLAASGDPAHAGQVAGTTQAELAWNLAACELGMDCGAQGALMTAWCANGGVCASSPHQDFPGFVHHARQSRGDKPINDLIDSLLREGVPR